jgi:hypothetical protein
MNESQLKLFSGTFAEFTASEAFRVLCEEVASDGMSLPEAHISMEEHARKHIYKLGMRSVLDRIKLYSVALDAAPDPYHEVELEDETLDDNALDLLEEKTT